MRKKIIIGVVVLLLPFLFFVFANSKDAPKTDTDNRPANTATTNSGPTLEGVDTVQFNQGTMTIDVDNYRIVSVVYFENNTWALATVEPKAYQAQASKLVVQYDTNTKKWIQITEPVEVFSPSIQTKVPASLYGYLQSQNMILAHRESR